jgi:hypothetical protein
MNGKQYSQYLGLDSTTTLSSTPYFVNAPPWAFTLYKLIGHTQALVMFPIGFIFVQGTTWKVKRSMPGISMKGKF